MAARGAVDPAQTRAAVLVLREWLHDPATAAPERGELALAVRLTARTLAALAPGASVEVRIPPFVAVQCVSGSVHRRGAPPNIAETDVRTWLLLATGLISMQEAVDAGDLRLTGVRSGEIARWFPLVALE